MSQFNHTILYAEDDIGVQKEVVEYLEKYFKKVYVANDGKEALALYEKKSVDCMLLDINMPYVDGLEVANEVRLTNRTLPIVMLTAFTDTEKLLLATELHLCKYLVKPINILEFRGMIKKLLQEIEEQKQGNVTLDKHLVWNSVSKKLYKDGSPVSLSQKEQDLLDLFITKKNRCITFTDIMAKLWQDEFEREISIESVKVQVHNLRKKLPKESIKNVYGQGYLLNI